MPTQQTVLLVGGTGRTGRRLLERLLSSGINFRVIVRSAQRLPAGAVDHPNLAVVEANLLSLDDEDLQRHARGCDAVISCLGHVLSFEGVFFPPRDLNMENVAHVMCELLTNPKAWDDWKGKLPVIINTLASRS